MIGEYHLLAHNNHVIDGINKDVGPLYTLEDAKEYFLKLAEGWEDPYGEPLITTHDGIRVIRDDTLVGSKVRGGDCLISSLDDSIDTIVYVQPRTGLAGVSILDVAKRHNKDVMLFMPSSKRISHHQACCIERGAKVEFHRIAAMPNLNLIAQKWAAERSNAFFVPLGLKHEKVTAGVVKTASQIDEPEEVYVATSTGVLTRALQTFPTIDTYDGKVWKYIPKNTDRDILFWNVGQEPVLQNENLYETVDSYRDWAKNVA